MVSHYSYTLFVSLRNFVCKISEDTELLMALYDAKEGRVFTENYVVRWNKDSLSPDQLHNLRVLFTVSTFPHKLSIFNLLIFKKENVDLIFFSIVSGSWKQRPTTRESVLSCKCGSIRCHGFS